MRPLLPVLLVLCAACGTEPAPQDHPTTAPEAGNGASTVRLASLAGSGLRFNGVYETSSGDLHYYMRFFERGNVALVAGHETPAQRDSSSIALLLTENVQSGWNSVHNVPVTLRGDSVLFETMAMNGSIAYAGKVDGDTIRFVKASRINGKRANVAYGFVPDGSK